MAVSYTTSATISPTQHFAIGRPVLIESCQAVVHQLNYTYDTYIPPLAVVNMYGQSSSDFNPHGDGSHYTSLTYVYDFMVYVPAIYGDKYLRLGHTALVPTTSNTVTVSWRITGEDGGTETITDSTTNANSLVEQVTYCDLTTAPINNEAGGWVQVELGWYRTAGSATDNRLCNFRVQLARTAT